MRATRFDWDGSDAPKLAGEIRALQPTLGEGTDAVAEIVSAVEAEGDAAVLRFEERFGEGAPELLRVPGEELGAAPERIPPELAAALRTAIANVSRVAEAQAEAAGANVAAAGASVALQDVPVAAAGAYVPGGGAAYPSTAVMCCV
ncbi:MAG: histidinol dehydrogenase, partial [Solirubrobacterales bacterium]